MGQSRIPFYLIIATLVIVGLTTAWMRHLEMEIPFFPGERQPVWLVEARVDFIASGGEALVSLDLPSSPPGFRMFAEHAASPGYGFSTIEHEEIGRASCSERGSVGER